MDLIKAKEVAKFVLETSKIVVVLSNKSIWHLDVESEIEAVKEYANNNKLEMFIVKSEVEEPKKEKKK